MRRFPLLLLLTLALLLTACAPNPLQDAATPAGENLPLPVSEDVRAQETASTLWFRYGTEPCLAPESRLVTASPAKSYEQALVEALISGPGTAHTELTALFPQGTRVLSTHLQGRILFVTLSREIMNDFADEPDSWQNSSAWAAEIPLRRTLCMQSIAATITENCEVDEVVILVEQTSTATDSLRLRRQYYRDGGDPAALADPLTRDETLLLTPRRTAEIILECWQERDFARLYQYIARTDPANHQPLLEQSAFVAEMNGLPHLLDFTLSGGNVEGAQAVFTLEGAVLANGVTAELNGAILRLTRENGLWRVGLSQLTCRKEVTP